MDAIEKGMDPALYVERSRTAQRELAAATAVIGGHSPANEPPLSPKTSSAICWSVSATSSLFSATLTQTNGASSTRSSGSASPTSARANRRRSAPPWAWSFRVSEGGLGTKLHAASPGPTSGYGCLWP